MAKPILCLDFDGVLHGYQSGWVEADFIPDPPVPGAMQALVEYVKHFDVQIFSSRSHQVGGRRAMQNWLLYWLHKEFSSTDPSAADWVGLGNSAYNAVTFADEKPPAFLTIDDRAITFTGTWPDVETLRSFKPWNK